MKIAKYTEVTRWIQSRMQDGTFSPGAQIIPENELCRTLGVSRDTVRSALSVLENEGTIIKIRGKGTFVSANYGADLPGRKRIAVVTTYVNSYIFPKTISGIENVLADNGYSVQISFTNNAVERERAILEDLILKNDVAGVIIEPTKSGLPNPNLPLYRTLKNMRIPILFINSGYSELDIPCVSLDDKSVALHAVKYLIRAGHKKIGAVLKLDDGQGHRRYAGYIEALRAADLSIDDSCVIWIDTEDLRDLDRGKERILSRLSECTAVFGYNDEVAFLLIGMFREAGRRVPEDVSIVGIDGSDLSSIGEVKIVTVPHPMNRLGEKAAENLLKMIENSAFDGSFLFDPKVIPGTSVLRI